jgi:hypothetical protein
VTAPAGRFLVVGVEWDDDGEARQELYGPWAAAADDSHLAAITEFVKGWPDRAGVPPKAVTLTVLADPASWLAGRDAVTERHPRRRPGPLRRARVIAEYRFLVLDRAPEDVPDDVPHRNRNRDARIPALQVKRPRRQ